MIISVSATDDATLKQAAKFVAVVLYYTHTNCHKDVATATTSPCVFSAATQQASSIVLYPNSDDLCYIVFSPCVHASGTVNDHNSARLASLRRETVAPATTDVLPSSRLVLLDLCNDIRIPAPFMVYALW